ncbi:sigma-54-dependent Fis family transcriptional regulator [Celeribacter sp. PS-C1]|uniref:sigma-54 interaction domain-containing protein n=1 Tax=Celeribacter sp. PS-C1 TaxID=2820813 RepID=UPI001CA5B2B3|nr:sigma 54-interacting transcriptional regulator [Celeribacter sp. PS-C1]MBW6418518.1 sigma 54-interacting transcriptional regulator [Celeribacter sp. PS-C1]
MGRTEFATASSHVGVAIVGTDGQVLAALGKAEDPRIQAMVSDEDWIAQAREKRIVPMLFADAKCIAHVAPVSGGYIVLLSDEPGENVLNFVLNVDFAYDIIEHILTDPYDAMAVVDAKAKLAYISPVHEKFFGLRAGEGLGRPVRDVIENTRLHHVLKTGIAEVGQIQKMGSRERVVSRHPIRRNEAIVGAIGRVMFKGPQQVQAMARRINVLEAEVETYKKHTKEITQTDKSESFLDAIIGKSPAIQSVRQQIRKIAPLDIPVLIQGESGTGKELVARALHMLSARQDARLVTVNAAALPESLVESELFGYEAGSFTGAAKKGKAGKFEMADKGTIFLDEIGDMPLDVQSKLLRVLQDRVVERVGGDKPKHVDFRLCSATNRDLEAFVDQGKFRLDLFYRISPIVIRLPTLEERIEDIPLLVNHFVREIAEHHNRTVPEVDIDVTHYLMDQSWPGNIRQLRHILERAFVFAEEGRLSVRDFENGGAMMGEGDKPDLQGGPRTPSKLKGALDDLEQKLIADALARFNGNKKKAAEYLGVSRSYLYTKLDL